MPSGMRETDSAFIKRSLTSVDNKLSAQNEEICALKLQISELTSLVTLLFEGKSKCDKCNISSIDESNFASANEKEDTLTMLGGTETKRKQVRKRKNKANKGQNSKSTELNKTSTPKKRRSRKSKSLTAREAPVLPLSQAPRSRPELHNNKRNEDDNEGWSTAGSRKQRNNQNRRNKRVVRGSGASSELLCAADNTKYLHVWGAHPDTMEANVISYLNDKTKCTCSAVRMSSKRPSDYASFKVGVPENIFDECVKPQFWPKGFYAERWLFRLERPSSSTETK